MKPKVTRKSVSKAKPMSRKPTQRRIVRRPPSNPPFSLDDWYSSEEAKRRFGRICQAVNENHCSVELLGSDDCPYLCLVDAEKVQKSEKEYEITIEKAVADWSSVINAALFFGTVFRIRGKKVVRAVLQRHPVNRPDSFAYGRPQVDELTKSAAQLLERQTNLLQEQREVLEEQRRAAQHLDTMWREFKNMWREINKLPPL